MPDEEMRIAKTESLFRDVNEGIAASALRFGSERAEFVCECHDPTCTSRLEVSLEDYERIRSEGTHFLLEPGHEDGKIERVVERRKRFAIVEKFQCRIAAAVRRMNPRRPRMA